MRAGRVWSIHRSSVNLFVSNLPSDPHLLIVGFCQAYDFLFPVVPCSSSQAMTSSSLLHLSALFHLFSEIFWNILSTETASSHFPSTLYCSLCCCLFILFKKYYFTIISVGFKDWERQSMFSLPSWTRSLLCSIFHFFRSFSTQHFTFEDLKQATVIMWSFPRGLLGHCPPFVHSSFSLTSEVTILSRLCLHSLQPFPSPPK